MNTNDTILGAIEPDVAERIAQAGDEIAQGRTTSSTLMSGLAMASVPIALAALSRDAFGQANVPGSVIGVLDFALALEIFENEFYKAVLGISSSAAQNAAFATVRAKVPAAAVASIQQIQKHEAAHVAFLSSQPGVTNAFNLTADSFDFTGARGAGNGPFATATTDLNFLLLTAQGAEDTGVRAYKGQAPVLMATGDTATLEYALRIHSVEARHASKIRRLRRQNGATTVKFSGTITGASAGAENISNPPAAAVTALAAIYNGEDNTAQGGITVTGLSNLPSSNFIAANAATEAFDEPLTRPAVVAIVQPFFIPTIS
jgi:hypothetical protein